MKKTIVPVTLLVIIIAGCGARHHKKVFFRMDTVIEITVSSGSQAGIDVLWKSADSLLSWWETRFSVTGGESEVLKVNNRKSDGVRVSETLGEMVGTALRFSDTLDGGFDITILPVKEAWGLAEDSPDSLPSPSPAQLEKALNYVDYHNVKINVRSDSLYFKYRPVRIDIGGVAKGFVLRDLDKLLKKQGFENYLISAGGDIICGGKRRDGRPWVIGIQHPRRSSGHLLGTLELDSGSVVTSGDYERYRIIDGVRVHHIFDSRTGTSCGKNQSVTVWGIDPVEVDILSTGLFCRDAADIISFIDRRDHLEGVAVDSSGKIFVSSGWKDLDFKY